MLRRGKKEISSEEDWLAELRKLHTVDQRKRRHTAGKAEEIRPQADLLKQAKAYPLMRQVQKNFLNGGGLLDASEGVGRYDRAVTLVWQGSVSEPRRPNPKDPSDYFYVQVGLRRGDLWVNNRRTPAKTMAELRHYILKACQSPAKFDRDERKSQLSTE